MKLTGHETDTRINHYVNDARGQMQFRGSLANCRAWAANQQKLFTVFGFKAPSFSIYHDRGTEPAEVLPEIPITFAH